MFLEQKIEQILKQQEVIFEEIRSIKKQSKFQADQILVRDALATIARVSDLSINVPLNHPSIFTGEFVDTVYEFEIRRNGRHIKEVMNIRDASFSAGERSSPADPMVLSSGYFRTMLKRYLFAGKVFSNGQDVLDLCCGRGWGTRLLAEYANHITAFDYEPDVVTESKSYWQVENVNWQVGNALDTSFLGDKRFDVATCMEAIEHFTRDDGVVMLQETIRALKDRAVLVGTSYFPDTRHQADNHATLKREDHHYLWTKDELRQALEPSFDSVWIIDSWMFIAIRGH